MSRFIASVAAFVSAGTLLCAGWWHATRFKHFVRTLHEHRVWPARTLRFVAAAVLFAEIALGLVGFALLSRRSMQANYIEVTLALSASLFGAFGVYASVLTLVRPGVSCGCSDAHEPISAWISGRAFLLSLGAMYAALNAEDVNLLGDWGPNLIIIALASVALGVLVWTAPVAFGDLVGLQRSGDPLNLHDTMREKVMT